MSDLMKYDAACKAIAECKTLLEAKDLHDKAAAMEFYARAAKNEQLEMDAKAIRMRAIRRLGQMMEEQPKAKPGGDMKSDHRVSKKPNDFPTLAEQGIDKNLAHKARKLSALSEKDFENTVNGARRAKQGSGHSKGSTKPRTGPQQGRRTDIPEAAHLVLDQGMSYDKAAEATDTSLQTVRASVAREEGRREGRAEPERADLSRSAQEKFDAAIRRHKAALDASFYGAVNARVKEFVDATILPDWRQKIEQAHKLYEKRRALMDKETFNTIRRALHPDSRQSISDAKLGHAFDAFMALEKYLLNEKDSPTAFGDTLPRTWADWERAKQKATAERRARRGHSSLRPR